MLQMSDRVYEMLSKERFSKNLTSKLLFVSKLIFANCFAIVWMFAICLQMLRGIKTRKLYREKYKACATVKTEVFGSMEPLQRTK